MSLDLCPGAPGSGPPAILGICLVTPANIGLVLKELSLLLGAEPIHFVAAAASWNFGPYAVPPLTFESLAIELAGGTVASFLAVTRFTVQKPGSTNSTRHRSPALG